MKRIGLILLFVVLSMVGFSAPVRNMPVVKIQPNGDTLRCFVSGDEFFHRLHDANGFTIVQDVATGEYVYAMVREGRLAPTEHVAGKVDPRTIGLKPGLMPDARELRRLHRLWDEPKKKLLASAKPGPTSSELNNVVIFIRFADEDSLVFPTFESINAKFNDSTPSASSMFNYFKVSSYHQMRVVSTYHPAPSGSMVRSYQDSHPRAYYEPYSAANTLGYSDEDEHRLREFALLQNAVNWVNGVCPLPNTINLDRDNDGYIDNICFVASGTYTGWSDLLWPHKWALFDREVYINGKRVWTFNFQLAGSGEHYFGVSTFCHEMSHTLGAPDLYSYYDYTDVSAAGSFDLMCVNSTPPQQINALYKMKYLGWFDSIPQITEPGVYTLSSYAAGPNTAVKIASPLRNEWYILEYRNNTDTFDSSIPNRGLLVWRFNQHDSASNSMFNGTSRPHEMWLFRPYSMDDTTNGSVAMSAMGILSRSTFSAACSSVANASNPYPYLSNGTPDTSFSLTNISVSGDGQSVSFLFEPRNVSGEASFPLVQDFESGLSGWLMRSGSASNIVEFGIKATDSMAHNGSHSFRFSSQNPDIDRSQELITPNLEGAGELHLRFYYRSKVVTNSALRLLYSTTNTERSHFVQTISMVRPSDTLWHRCDAVVPAAAKYLSFRFDGYYGGQMEVDEISMWEHGSSSDQHDTIVVRVFDTIYNILGYDTVEVYNTDSLGIVIYDTVYNYLRDTIYYVAFDTIVRYDTAVVAPRLAEIMAFSNERHRGKASGSGKFPIGTSVQMAAIPYKGYEFSHWTDGCLDNPRTVTVDYDVMYGASFVPDALAKDAGVFVVSDTCYVHDSVMIDIRDTFYIDHRDTVWYTVHEPFDVNIIDTDYVVSRRDTVVDIRILEVDTTARFSVVVRSEDSTMGWAAGNGLFPRNSVVEVAAVRLPGYRFVGWTDGNTENPRKVQVLGDIVLTARFEFDDGTVDISEQDINPEANVYTEGETIVVVAPQGRGISVYNALGRLVYQTNGQSAGTAEVRTVIDNLPRGFYAVKVGKTSVYKVMVAGR